MKSFTIITAITVIVVIVFWCKKVHINNNTESISDIDVGFPDPQFNKIVSSKLHTNFKYYSKDNLLSITELVDCRKKHNSLDDSSYTPPITSIEGLSKIKNLKLLHLENHEIKDIHELTNMKKLEILRLRENKITNVNELFLENLKILDLSKNTILCIDTLENLKQLEELDLSYNNRNQIAISDFQRLGFILYGLEKLKYLKKLNLESTSISNIMQFDSLTNLEELNIKYTNLDITPIKNFKKLKKLALSGTSCNLDIISQLGNLEELHICGSKLVDISPLKNLINLEKLNLSHNEIEDITPLKKLNKLKELNLSLNNVKNIDALNNLTNLKTINLSHNKISTSTNLNASTVKW